MAMCLSLAMLLSISVAGAYTGATAPTTAGNAGALPPQCMANTGLNHSNHG